MEDWGRVNRCALIQLDLSTAVARPGTPSLQTAIIAKVRFINSVYFKL